MKLSAFGLSVFLWALVQTEPLSEETFSSVPVQVDIADTSWTTAGPPSPAAVELRLGGPAREIIRLAREGISISVPVGTVGSRDTLIALQREWVELGPGAGVTVESISPATVSVSFEPAVTRRLPVAVRVQGELPDHLALSSDLVVTPEEVLVRGPESNLDGLDSVPLEPFDLTEVSESDGFDLAVDTTGLAGASVTPSSAMLVVRVDPREERVLPSVPVQATAPAGEGAVVVEPDSIQLRLAGARPLVQALDLFLVRVSVPPESMRGMQEGEERRVALQVEGVPPLVNAYPSTEVVTVRRAIDVQSGAEDARNRQ